MARRENMIGGKDGSMGGDGKREMHMCGNVKATILK